MFKSTLLILLSFSKSVQAILFNDPTHACDCEGSSRKVVGNFVTIDSHLWELAKGGLRRCVRAHKRAMFCRTCACEKTSKTCVRSACAWA